MDPQHLARLDDDGSVRRISTGTAGGATATVSPGATEVSVSAPVSRAPRPRTPLRGAPSGGVTIVLRGDRFSDSWPLPADELAPAGSDAWPLPDLGATGTADSDDTTDGPGAATATAEAVVAAVAAGQGPRHRRPSTRSHRPALYLAAAFIGAAGIAATAAATDSTQVAAQADEPVSVAEELGMVQA